MFYFSNNSWLFYAKYDGFKLLDLIKKTNLVVTIKINMIFVKDIVNVITVSLMKIIYFLIWPLQFLFFQVKTFGFTRSINLSTVYYFCTKKFCDQFLQNLESKNSNGNHFLKVFECFWSFLSWFNKWVYQILTRKVK